MLKIARSWEVWFFKNFDSNLFMMHRVFRWLKNKGNINFGVNRKWNLFLTVLRRKTASGSLKSCQFWCSQFLHPWKRNEKWKTKYFRFFVNEWRQNPGFMVTKSLYKYFRFNLVYRYYRYSSHFQVDVFQFHTMWKIFAVSDIKNSETSCDRIEWN